MSQIQDYFRGKGVDPQQVSKLIYNDNKNNPDYWNYLSKETELTTEFITEHLNNLNIDNLCNYQKLDNKVTTNKEFTEKLNLDNWNYLIQNQQLNEDTIELYIQFCINNIDESTENNINWESISKDQDLSIGFIRKYSEHLNWYWISQEQFMTFEFIIEFRDKIDWEFLPFNQELQYLFTDGFVHLFETKIIWKNIGLMEQVTIECLEMYFDRISLDSWYTVFENKKLSLILIDKVLNKWCQDSIIPTQLWDSLSQNPFLSNDIIYTYENDLNWDILALHHNFDLETIYKYKHKINLEQLSRNDHLTLDMIKNLEPLQNEFQNKFDWDYISEFGNIDKDFVDTSENITKDLTKNNDNLDI